MIFAKEPGTTWRAMALTAMELARQHPRAPIAKAISIDCLEWFLAAGPEEQSEELAELIFLAGRCWFQAHRPEKITREQMD